MDLGLRGRRALVTGGSHGIGLAISLGLAREGCDVAICGRSEERLAKASEAIERCGANCIATRADVLEDSGVESVKRAIARSWSSLDILVNNVGGGGRWGTTFEETADQVWMDVYRKNTLAAVRFTRFAIPMMRRNHWGRVVTIASIYGKEAGGRPWFNLSKSSEISLMKTLAAEKNLVRNGITFNSVAPGNIMIPETGWETERRKRPSAFKAFVEGLPMGRLGTPEEVANTVLFICSKGASFVNGACFVVDGGESRSF